MDTLNKSNGLQAIEIFSSYPVPGPAVTEPGAQSFKTTGDMSLELVGLPIKGIFTGKPLLLISKNQLTLEGAVPVWVIRVQRPLMSEHEENRKQS